MLFFQEAVGRGGGDIRLYTKMSSLSSNSDINRVKMKALFYHKIMRKLFGTHFQLISTDSKFVERAFCFVEIVEA